jgi:hypothetical protein
MKLQETEICFNWSSYGKKKSEWLLFPLCDRLIHIYNCVQEPGLGKLGPRDSQEEEREKERE